MGSSLDAVIRPKRHCKLETLRERGPPKRISKEILSAPPEGGDVVRFAEEADILSAANIVAVGGVASSEVALKGDVRASVLSTDGGACRAGR
jgi:hypothetical protein